MYLLLDGSIVSYEEIALAYLKDQAVVVLLWNANPNHGGRIVKVLMLDGQHYDTRDCCCGLWWRERWTNKPVSLAELMEIANKWKVTQNVKQTSI